MAFGTSRLHYVDGRTRRLLIDVALDMGVLHFDTAPAYGDGLAETELGAALRKVRPHVIIATKYGISPNPIMAAAPQVGSFLRAARGLGRRLGLSASRNEPITAPGLRRSVHASLRRLSTDYIDILLLHEPTPARLQEPLSLLEELKALQSEGHIRNFGLAGAWSGLDALGSARLTLGMIQQTHEYQWSAAEPPDITYSAIASSPQSFASAAIPPSTASERLARALLRRRDGAVIVSTTNIKHLRILASIAGAT